MNSAHLSSTSSPINAGNCARYKVVVNHEEQYSVWLCGMANAPGWRDAGFADGKSECLAWIRAVWTDMRPLSLRRVMTQDQSWSHSQALTPAQ
ncbi:MAG: MbtH family protein [Janthinobacterium lividum]